MLLKFHNKICKGYYNFKLYRFPLLKKCIEEFERNQWLSQNEIKHLQWNRLKIILEHAYRNVPYYQKLFRKHNILPERINDDADFRKIPILTKRDIRHNLEDLRARNFCKKDMVKSASGGSTGEPVPFYHDYNFSLCRTALKLRNLRWTDWEIGDPRIVLWGSSLDIDLVSGVKGKISNWLDNLTILPAFKMSKANMLRFIKRIKHVKPKIIAGYTIPLIMLAKYVISSGEDLRSIRMKGIINAAETLYNHQREFLRNTFGCKVFNKYGGRELSDIAHECRNGSLHINADWLYVEFVSDEGKPVRNGEMGNVILTGLYNFGMPFIRYKVDDLAVPSGKECTCGRGLPVMEKIIGREQDMILLKNGNYLAGEFFPHLFKDFDIEKFQVVQESLNLLNISIVKGENFHSKDLEYLKRKIREYTKDIEINFFFVEEIKTSRSGKFRFTISKVPFNKILGEKID